MADVPVDTALAELERALMALRLEAPADVVDDVRAKVRAALASAGQPTNENEPA